ncbi:MAG: ABC transporter ATP-binding protein [Atopobiaceae bacterium]|jgi:multiple sugar transport system ATP-binding protein
MASLSFSHICKKYFTGTEAVRNFNLEVSDGEFVVLIGPSGCGKSTVLRMVAGLEDITDGDLTIGDTRVNDLPPKARNVAMVFQNYALFPNMTVEENMGFALKMQHVKRGERKERVHQMAEILQIEDLLPKEAKHLSGGQCQRIAIGRALVCEPDVFLLDEPLSNLDAQMRHELRSVIAELQKQQHVTTLYVTHDLTEAMTLGDRIVLMEKGQIKQVATPQVICQRPANVFAAKFVTGSNINIIDATCSLKAGQAYLTVGSQRLRLPDWKYASLEAQLEDGQEVQVGIHAEDIMLNVAKEPPADGTIEVLSAEVASIENLGMSGRAYLRVAEQVLNAMASDMAGTTPGTEISIGIPLSRILLFEKEGGARIDY